MKNHKSHPTIWVWILCFGVGVLFITTLYYKKTNSFDWIEYSSIMGSFLSLFGLVLMIFQFKSVRKTTEETKERIDTIYGVSDFSKAAETIRSVETDIERDDFSIACYKLKSIKDLIIRNNGDLTYKNSESIVRDINSVISTLNQTLLEGNNSIDKTGLVDELEGITDCFNILINNHKNNI